MAMKKFHTIYKITNLINNKIYIGVHSTDDLNDSYMGSGDKLKLAIKKYGKKNFRKETLMLFNSKEDAYFHEGLIITKDFINQNNNYNATPGGKIPPDPSGKPNLGVSKARKGICLIPKGSKRTIESRIKQSKTLKESKRLPPSQKDKKKRIIQCPQCFKTGGSNLMKRWHFNNCKKEKQGD